MPDDKAAEYENLKRRWRGNGAAAATGLGEWDAGDDTDPIPPREWLLGNSFCRRFISCLIADGSVGKTALRIAQALALASGRALTGEHVFERSRVIIVSLEDDRDELRRRVRAAMLYHGIKYEDVRGYLFLSAPGAIVGKVATLESGVVTRGTLLNLLGEVIERRHIDIVILDPFVRAHGVEESDNTQIDLVMQFLSDVCAERNIAIDVPHHASKGLAEPGDANRGRGAGAMKNAARLVYTLTPMSRDEATKFGIPDAERRALIRLDPAKVNLAPSGDATWFKLVGVSLGNATPKHPKGDNVQSVEPWTPPDVWTGTDSKLLNAMLDQIARGLPDGNKYTDGPRDVGRAAWSVITEHAPAKGENQARQIIRTWIKSGLLRWVEYKNPITRKTVKGLEVDNAKRPT
jgi:hypothetical protein